MNPEWVVTGIILLGAMAAGSISLYIKRKRNAMDSDVEFSNESEDKTQTP